MEEALILTSGKEAAGMGVIDLRTGCSLTSNFKNCIAEAGALCAVGSSTSAYSGYGSSGDYIAVAQAKKPSIHIWQWGKPQVHLQCHIQEIVTALAVDPSGAFLLAGTLKGWIYCWELSTGELINTFQAHFKAINRISVTRIGAPFCISVSEDGTGRAWEMHKILDISEAYKHVGRHSLAPFRTWSAHTLPIKDSYVMDSLTTLRVLTCSLDRTVVLYDVLQSQLCLRVSLPHALESLTCNATQDLVCAGSSNGNVYIIDLTSTAVAVTAAHAHVSHHTAHSTATGTEGLPRGTSVLEGHTKSVTSVCFSRDNSSLVSASADGTVRVWNVWTRQCVKEFTPLGKHGITNATLIPIPETLSIGVSRPTFCPVAHLNKYFKSQQTQQIQQGGAGAGAGANGSTAVTSANTGAGANNNPSASAGAVNNTTGNTDGAPSVMLGPTFLSRHENLLVPDRKRAIHVVSPAQSSSSVHSDAMEECVTEEAAEEEYLALSEGFNVPKKAKLSNKKRKSLAADEAAAAAAEEHSAAVAQKEEELQSVSAQLQAALAQVQALQSQNAQLQQQKVQSPVPVPTTVPASASKQSDKKSKLNQQQSTPVVATAEKEKEKMITPKKSAAVAAVSVAEAPVEEEVVLAEEEVVAQPAKRSRRASLSAIPNAPSAPLLATTSTESKSRIPLPSAVTKDSKVTKAGKAAAVVAPVADVAAPADAEVAVEDAGESKGRKGAKKAVQFSGSDSIKFITPHKLPEFKNSIIPVSSIYAPASSSSTSSNSGKSTTDKHAGPAKNKQPRAQKKK